MDCTNRHSKLASDDGVVVVVSGTIRRFKLKSKENIEYKPLTLNVGNKNIGDKNSHIS